MKQANKWLMRVAAMLLAIGIAPVASAREHFSVANEGVRDTRTRFFVAAAWFSLAVAIVGFTKTFFMPLAGSRFHAPPIVFIHGALFFGWVSLFVLQTNLIRLKKRSLHRVVGWCMAVMAIGMMIATVAVQVFAVKRDVAIGGGQTAISNLVGGCTSMLLFGGLVTAGVLNRHRPDFHKRLMLLATISVMWPAWFRFRHYFPSVPHPEYVFAIFFANTLTLVAMLYDKFTIGRIHPVYLWVGLGIIAEQTMETLLFDNAGWRVVANWLAGFLL